MLDKISEKSGFTVRSVAIAAVLSLFLLLSTSYVALKLGIAPWPIIFSVIVSGGILKILKGKTDLNEINTAQAGASIGGLVAAAIVFTVPAILFLNQNKGLNLAWPNPWLLGAVTVTAGLLGVALSVPLKTVFIDEEQLPYPAGTAGAELLKLGKTGGKELALIVTVGAAAGIFALLRDTFFPAGLTVSALAVMGIFLTFLPLPMAVAGGYILGPRAGFSWLAGAIVGWLVVTPILFQQGIERAQTTELVQNLGMGLVMGAGMGFFAGYIIPRFKKVFHPWFRSKESFFRVLPGLAFLAVVALIFSKVPLIASVFTIIGVFITVTVAARMTGETNIDPLEQFGIFVGLIISLGYTLLHYNLSMEAMLMIITFVSVACAIAGDAGHDYKSAAIVGTPLRDIVRVDMLTVIIAGFAAPFVLELYKTAFSGDLFTPVMPAPQAQLVAGSIFGFAFPEVFISGFTVAFILEISYSFMSEKFRDKLLLMPFGIGLFLGPGLAIPIALGAWLRVFIDKKYSHLYHRGVLIAAGVMGGEGIAGFTAGALRVTTLDQQIIAGILSSLLIAILMISIKKYYSANE